MPYLYDVASKTRSEIPTGRPLYLFTRGPEDGLTGWIIEQGRTTGALWDEVKPLVDASRAIVDCGAHFGVFAVEFANLTKTRYYCFEPQRGIFLQLCANLLLNDISHAVPFCCAVGSPSQDGLYVGLYDSPVNHDDVTRLV